MPFFSSDASASGASGASHSTSAESSPHLTAASSTAASTSTDVGAVPAGVDSRDVVTGQRRTGSVRSSVLLLVAAGVLWGTGGITGRLLADATDLPGPSIAAYRLGLGGVVLVGYCLARRIALPRGRAQWAHVVILGVLAAVFQAAFFSAVRLGSVTLATLVSIGSAPIVVLGIERLQRQPMTRGRLRAAGLGVVGLALLVGATEGGRSVSAVLASCGLALLAGTAFAAFALQGRRAPVELDPQAGVGVAFTVGGGLLALGAAPTIGMGVSLDARSLGLLALLAIVPTAVAYGLFFRGLRGASASTAVVIALLEPTTATVLSVVLLHERLTFIGVFGAALLLVSVVDAARAETRRPLA